MMTQDPQDSPAQNGREETPEEAPLEERLWEEAWRALAQELAPGEARRLFVWPRVISAVRITSRSALAVSIFFGILLGLRLLFNMAMGRDALFGLYALPVFIVVFIVMLAAMAAEWGLVRARARTLEHLIAKGRVEAALVEALRSGDVRKGAAAQEARLQFERERTTGPAWWRVEVSGLHFLWLLALAVVVVAALSPDTFAAPMIIFFFFAAVVGGFLKLAYWIFWLFAAPETKVEMMRLYRWGGTLSGSMDMLVVGLILFFVFAFAFIILSRLFGG